MNDTPIIPGVGPEAAVETNSRGGQQSASPYSFTHSFTPKAILEVAKVVKYGLVKYQSDNWRLIPRSDHLNHALVHLFAYLAGDAQDDHLAHAATRLLFAMETKDLTPLPR